MEGLLSSSVPSDRLVFEEQAGRGIFSPTGKGRSGTNSLPLAQHQSRLTEKCFGFATSTIFSVLQVLEVFEQALHSATYVAVQKPNYIKATLQEAKILSRSRDAVGRRGSRY